MIKVYRTRTIDASPSTIFDLLSDSESLPTLLPRVSRVEFLQQVGYEDQARIATYMALGPFGELRSEGTVQWEVDREVAFVSHKPVYVESRWTLSPSGAGTTVDVALTLDLAPLLGPLAKFIPPEQVTGMVIPDLDTALSEVARRVETMEGVI